MHPEVSIIIPSYRSASTLPAALRSAAAQHISHEILLIDGSMDEDTARAVEQSGVRPDHWIRESDTGVYDAINKGIKRARGNWIYILGSDDELASAVALAQLADAASEDTQVVCGDIENVGRSHRRVPLVHHSGLGAGILLRNTLHQQGTLYRRSLFGPVPFQASYRVLGDYDFHLTLYRRKIPWVYVPVLVARCSASGLSKHFDPGLYREEWHIRRSHKIPLAFLVWLKYAYKKITG